MQNSKNNLLQLLAILGKETKFVNFEELQAELSLGLSQVEDLVIELEDRTKGVLKFRFAEEGAVVLLSHDKVKKVIDSGILV